MLRFYEPLEIEYERDHKSKDPILGFSNERYKFLSNFYPCTVRMYDIDFPSSEYAYMWHKSDDLDYKKSILNAYSSGQAKKLGNNKRLEDLGILRKDWPDDLVRIKVMYEILKAKFSDINLWVMLQATENRYIEETNWWSDVFWGRCRGKGENHLGRLQMVIRHETRR